jgi:hypothetical protein
VCGKCQVHFANIESCDWRPAQRSRRPNTKRCQKEVVSLNRPCTQSRGSGDESSNSDSNSGETLVSSSLVISYIDPSAKTLDTQGFHFSSQCRCPCHEPGSLHPISNTNSHSTHIVSSIHRNDARCYLRDM